MVSVPAAAAPSGVVTFLFTDVEGSTRRWEADADAMREALAAHDEVLRSSIEAHDGFLFSHTCDGVAAAFASRRSAVDAEIRRFRQRIDTCELGAQTVATDQGGPGRWLTAAGTGSRRGCAAVTAGCGQAGKWVGSAGGTSCRRSWDKYPLSGRRRSDGRRCTRKCRSSPRSTRAEDRRRNIRSWGATRAHPRST